LATIRDRAIDFAQLLAHATDRAVCRHLAYLRRFERAALRLVKVTA
jgi:hypothetical protein